MKCYRIKGWDKYFENNRTRELKKLDWVPIPNKHDGDGFTELLDHPQGMAHYGAWNLLVGIASKCDPRGTLLRDGSKPHDIVSLCRVSRGNPKVFEQAIPRLISIGWIEVIDLDSGVCVNPAPSCGVLALSCDEVPIEGKGREGKGTEEKEGSASAGALLLLVYLNEKAGRKFAECEENLKLIRARLEDCLGDVEGCKQMIDRQCLLWKGDPTMDQYLRPKTLFGKQNFRSYYDDRSRPAYGTNNNQQSARPNRSTTAQQRNAAIQGAEQVRESARAKDAAPDTGPWMAALKP
jgi:uncharacterized phage protein (TIGR02220 family)